MQFNEINGNIVIEDAKHFNIEHIFECGQNFRFQRCDENIYSGVAFGRVIKLMQKNDMVILYNVTKADFEEKWMNYLALDEDYGAIKSKINTDDIILHALNYGSGIRILKQDLWEMMISFIVSQNNNIPRIKKIIGHICENYGSRIQNTAQYAFPSIVQMEYATQEDLRQLGLGYRDSYITDAVQKISWGEIDLDKIKKFDTDKARLELMKIKGIGGKVADCILLFGLCRYEVCPHDVWVKRIFSGKYNIEKINEKKGYEFAQQKWGKYAGIAQQYLFYCERENYRQPNN